VLVRRILTGFGVEALTDFDVKKENELPSTVDLGERLRKLIMRRLTVRRAQTCAQLLCF